MAKNNKILTITCPEVSVVHDEKDEGLEITVELPGVSKKDVDLNVSKQGFCVSANREDMRYEGCFQFAHEVDSDKTKAKFENGLLLMTVPFVEALCGKKIAIE